MYLLRIYFYAAAACCIESLTAARRHGASGAQRMPHSARRRALAEEEARCRLTAFRQRWAGSLRELRALKAFYRVTAQPEHGSGRSLRVPMEDASPPVPSRSGRHSAFSYFACLSTREKSGMPLYRLGVLCGLRDELRRKQVPANLGRHWGVLCAKLNGCRAAQTALASASLRLLRDWLVRQTARCSSPLVNIYLATEDEGRGFVCFSLCLHLSLPTCLLCLPCAFSPYLLRFSYLPQGKTAQTPSGYGVRHSASLREALTPAARRLWAAWMAFVSSPPCAAADAVAPCSPWTNSGLREEFSLRYRRTGFRTATVGVLAGRVTASWNAGLPGRDFIPRRAASIT